MDSRFAQVKVLVWDFDGTLYKPHPELWHDVREAEYRVIVEHTGWARDNVLEEFAKLHAPGTSATDVVAKLSSITTVQAALEMERYYDRTSYLKPDDKLVKLFDKLSRFRHVILANGVRKNIEHAVKALGLKVSLFETIVTSEVSGSNKPNPEGFRYVLRWTKRKPNEHLMIGDREAIDLLPAKKLGIKTCLVLWGKPSNSSADATIPTVYDVVNLIG